MRRIVPLGVKLTSYHNYCIKFFICEENEIKRNAYQDEYLYNIQGHNYI
jgi:hypothetical protein